MKYKKGSFITVPNSDELMGLHSAAQCLFMWLCFHANQEGVCFPSRKRLSVLCSISLDTVDKMLKLLEAKELIIKTKRKKNELQNQTNLYEVIIGGVAVENGHLAVENGQGVAVENGSELNPVILTQQTKDSSVATPSKTARDFFDNVDIQEKLAENIAEKYKVNIDEIKRELNKFIAYWTEPNKSGSKQKWEMEKCFEITRRLTTWFGNSNRYKTNKTNNKSKTIIGLE